MAPDGELCPQTAVESVSEWEAEEVNFEGLRVSVDEGNGRAGWLMNRLSLHEPIVIFNVESVRAINLPLQSVRQSVTTIVVG